MESCDSNRIGDGRAWEVDGRAQALVGPGLATPLVLLLREGILVDFEALVYNNIVVTAQSYLSISFRDWNDWDSPLSVWCCVVPSLLFLLLPAVLAPPIWLV